MRTVFRLISGLRHWQVFAILVVPYLAISVLMIPDPEPGRSVHSLVDEFSRLMLIASPLFLFLYVWIWTVGVVCNQALESTLRRSTKLLNVAMPFGIAYLVFAVWAWPHVMLTQEPAFPVGALMILHVIAVLALMYGFVFAARSVGSLGRAYLVGFGRTLLWMLAILYFPIGVWWIQPRLNQAAAHSPE